jgi:hypothetical protein
MSDHEALPPDIELDAVVATNRFLIEIAFSIICELHPDGKEAAFRTIESSLRGTLKRSVANPYPKSARDVQVSDEAERQVKIFLESLGRRIR